MVESLVGGKKAEVEAEAEDGEQHLFTKDSPGATMGNTAAAAKSTGGKQATPSVLQAATSIFKRGGGRVWRNFQPTQTRLPKDIECLFHKYAGQLVSSAALHETQNMKT